MHNEERQPQLNNILDNIINETILEWETCGFLDIRHPKLLEHKQKKLLHFTSVLRGYGIYLEMRISLQEVNIMMNIFIVFILKICVIVKWEGEWKTKIV